MVVQVQTFKASYAFDEFRSSMSSETFVLLNLPDVALTTPGGPEAGVLALKCVTVQAGDHHPKVYLVLRLNSFECPIDPTRPVYFSFCAQLGRRSYTLSSPDGSTLGLVLPLTTEPSLLEDQDMFHSILTHYAEMRHSTITSNQGLKASATAPVPAPIPSRQWLSGDHEAMHGRLVLIDENHGEIVGELDMNINEDHSISTEGRENDPVVIELPENDTRSALAVAIPPEDQDWIIKSASFASSVISDTTNLLLTTMTRASSYYIDNSTPHPSVGPSSGVATDTDTPPPPLPRALVFLTSENARKGLSTVHTMSAQAATLSTKTVSLLDSMITRAIGSNKKAQQSQPSHNGTPRSSLSSRSTSPQPPSHAKGSTLQQSHQPSSTYLAPTSSIYTPPFPTQSPSPSCPLSPHASDNKSPLPPGQSGRYPSSHPGATPGSSSPMELHHRLLLSADLIRSSVDSSVKQIVDIGAHNLGRAIEHKYGAEAARSAGLIAGTTKNIVAVYIGMNGIGRRAVITVVKRAGKEFLKARM